MNNDMELKIPEPQESHIAFYAQDENQEEIMRISKDGFFWRGEKVEDKYNIYERFNEWLLMAQQKDSKIINV